MSNDLGIDRSGNNNNWTPTNLAATDVVLDSPTNNFATLNPLYYINSGTNKAIYMELSEGNTKFNAANIGTNQDGRGMGTIAPSSGKWYWEMYKITSEVSAGISRADLDDPSGPGAQQVGDIYYLRDGRKRRDGALETYGASTTTADIVGIGLDLDGGSITFYKNGVSQGVAYNTGISGHAWYPMTHAGAGGSWYGVINFGQDSSFAGNKTAQGNQDSNNIGDFYYEPPTDFLALCTDNLPEPTVVPSEHFGVVTWTGNDSVQHITGLGFQPDLVWAKDRSAARRSNLIDVVRGTQARIFSSDVEAEAPNSGLSSFNSDGFSLTGGYSDTNHLNETFVAWCWKANGAPVAHQPTGATISAQVSANVDAGFSIARYTGNGVSGATIGHGLNQEPEMIISKRLTGGSWRVIHKDIGLTKTLYLDEHIAAGNDTERPELTDATVFTHRGTITDPYITYSFHSVEGFSKIGSYTGNGSTDGAFVYTGFKPRYVMVKRTDSAASWHIYDTEREPLNPNATILMANATNVEENNHSIYDIDFVSNGFKHRDTYAAQNASGGTYIYIAIAEDPFKHTNAR